MTNLLQDASEWFGQQLHNAAGRTVRYVRQGRESLPLTATPSKQEYEVEAEDGLPMKIASLDWTFTRSQLVFSDGSEIEPQQGDQIVETLGSLQRTHTVQPLGKQPCCEWLDTSGVLALVHTKEHE